MPVPYNALREVPAPHGYKAGDVLVLFGELFGRGYANGLVEEARHAGMTVIGATVGRRDGADLRSLTPEELAEAEANLGGTIINIPLEAGFDMEPAENGVAPVDQLKTIKPDGFAEARLDWDAINSSKERGTARFKNNVATFVEKLAPMIPAGVNVLFAHTMAGGIPRARVFMPLLNRIFKGTGDKYLQSEVFWNSDLGKLCQLSFNEVTGDTFRYLLEATSALRGRIEADGGKVAYTAYGYHGTEVLIDGTYRWQSYTPYVQGEAKMRLEDISAEAFARGIRSTVFNCPEIQTNSSALFLGVEISLYPLLDALVKEGNSAAAQEILTECRKLLKEGETVEGLLKRTNEYLSAPVMQQFWDLERWPHHNTKEQAETMLTASADLMAMSADPKNIVCAELSRAVFRSTGKMMVDYSFNPAAPVVWLNHDVIAKQINS